MGARKTNATVVRTRLAALNADRGIPQDQMAHAVGARVASYRRPEPRDRRRLWRKRLELVAGDG